MALNILVLKAEEEAWSKRAASSFVIGMGSIAAGGLGIGSSVVNGITKIANNVTYSAAGKINPDNVSGFLHEKANYTDPIAFSTVCLVFGFGIYQTLSSALAHHRAEKLADMIKEIESSPQSQYPAQAVNGQ